VKQLMPTAALALVLMANSGSSPSPRVRTLFLSGSPAPAGLTFASFGRAAVNGRGTVCFLAGWDASRHRPEGLFIRQGDQVTPIARAGDLISGSASERFSFVPDYPDDFASFSLNGQDQVAFVARQGLFFYDAGGVRPIARIGDAVPGVVDETWDEIDTVSLNNSGAVAFTGAIRSVTDGERQEGVFLVTGGSFQIVFFDGDQPADLAGALNSFAAVSLNDAGKLAVLATEGDDSLGCILLATVNDTSTVAVEGGPAPGGVWSSLGSVALNNQDVIAFQARVADASGDHGGIYRASAGSVTPVAVAGQAVGAEASDVYADYWGRPSIDDSGAVAFLANMTGSRSSLGLLRVDASTTSLLAAVGSAAPGGGPGAIRRFSGLSLGSMGPAGLVCGVSLAGGSVSDTLVEYHPGSAADLLLTTDSPLPPGASLTLADSQTASRNVQARINRVGELVFAADVGGYGRALFRMGPAGPELLTPLGRPRAGDPGLRSVVAFDLNDAGSVALLGARDEADQDIVIQAMDLHAPTVLNILATTQDPVPGSPNQRLTAFGPPAMDGSSSVFFAAVAQASDPSAPNQSYLLRRRGDELGILASEGQSVDGAGTLAAMPDANTVPAAPIFRELHVNTAGQALFMCGYQDSKTKAFNSNGLFLLTSGVVRAAALPGQVTPIQGGPVYTRFSSPRLSDDGAVIFEASVAGAGRKPRAGLFRRDADGTVTLAATGDPVPGWDGESYRAILDPAANTSAGVAFLALVDPPPAVGTPAALLTASGARARTALTDGDPVDGNGTAGFRVDEQFPPAPLGLQDDGTLFVASQLRGGPAPDGLFLVQPG
jgi:hypothetical protein